MKRSQSSQLVGQSGVELVEIGLIEWGNEKIPVQREPGHPFLKHRLTADHHITDTGVIQLFQEFFHLIPP